MALYAVMFWEVILVTLLTENGSQVARDVLLVVVGD